VARVISFPSPSILVGEPVSPPPAHFFQLTTVHIVMLVVSSFSPRALFSRFPPHCDFSIFHLNGPLLALRTLSPVRRPSSLEWPDSFSPSPSSLQNRDASFVSSRNCITVFCPPPLLLPYLTEDGGLPPQETASAYCSARPLRPGVSGSSLNSSSPEECVLAFSR